MAQPVKKEIERIAELLKGDITPKQRLALMIAQSTLVWIGSIKKDDVPESPSAKIMKAEVK